MREALSFPFSRLRVGRFSFLLLSILLLFALRPFLEGYVAISILTEMFFSLILISGIYAISDRKITLVIALIIGIPALLLDWGFMAAGAASSSLTARILLALFFLFALIIVLSNVMAREKVSSDVIMGAACAYFLFGILWAYVFFFLETALPGAFQFGAKQAREFAHFVYYSFVTLTTLGYGDITPVSSHARSLAVLEATTGQLYLAVLIARLVGMHILQLQEKQG